MEPHQVDLLIVGAGLHGLIMAKSYLEVHPTATMLVVDEAASVGGSWARERLYPGLKTNNIFGSYELSDFPMIPERYGVEGKGHIPGHVVHEYLCDVVQHFKISPHLMLSTKVTSSTARLDGSWEVNLQAVNDLPEQPTPQAKVVIARKMVIATGLTSRPNVPQIPGSDEFGRLMLHSKQLKAEAPRLRDCKTVVVIGGNKSAWDVCYTAAVAGAQVHMVIRPSGGGPSYLWPRAFTLGSFQVSLARLSATRAFTLFDPTIHGQTGPFAWAWRLIHRSLIGKTMLKWFWGMLDKRIRTLNGYRTHPELTKLEPWITPFWMGNMLSIHNYETSWFDLVREGRIHIHITDLETLSPGTVHLANRETLETDALVFCTGWRMDVPVNFEQPCSWDIKDSSEAENLVYAEIPYLRDLPRRTPNAPSYIDRDNLSPVSMNSSPLPQLYRHLVPCQPELLGRKNLAFIGFAISIHAVLVAQVQALWITAFFDDRIDHLRQDSIDYNAVDGDVRLHAAYGRLRRPHETGGMGLRNADLVFDSLPYIDCLLRDLAMRPTRKSNWWRELLEAYRLADYRGLVQEWMEQVRGAGLP